MVVVAVAWRQHLRPRRPAQRPAAARSGSTASRAGWLGDYTFALPAVGVVGTWFETGLVTVLLLAGMARIPRELYEAARLDGAGPVREFFAVALPAVRGEIAVALTLTVIAALRTFDLVYITTSGGPGTSTSVPSYEVYHRAFELGQVGSAAAIGVMPDGDDLRDHARGQPARRIGVPRDASAGRAARQLRCSLIVFGAVRARADRDDPGGRARPGPTRAAGRAASGNFGKAWEIGHFGTLPADQRRGVGVRSWWSACCCRSSAATRSARCGSAARGRCSTCSCSGS